MLTKTHFFIYIKSPLFVNPLSHFFHPLNNLNSRVNLKKIQQKAAVINVPFFFPSKTLPRNLFSTPNPFKTTRFVPVKTITTKKSNKRFSQISSSNNFANPFPFPCFLHRQMALVSELYIPARQMTFCWVRVEAGQGRVRSRSKASFDGPDVYAKKAFVALFGL